MQPNTFSYSLHVMQNPVAALIRNKTPNMATAYLPHSKNIAPIMMIANTVLVNRNFGGKLFFSFIFLFCL